MDNQNAEILDLIEMCENDPEAANKIVLNTRLKESWSNVAFSSIPWAIYISRSLGSCHLNRLVTIKGSVIKTYPVFFTRVFGEQICLKCNEKAKLEEKEMSSKKTGHICTSCGSSYVKINQVFNEAIPTQSIRIQDIGNFGVVSETVEILLEGNSTGKFSPGDKVVVTGQVTRKWKQIKKNEQLLSTICIKSFQIDIQKDSMDSRAVDSNNCEFSLKSTFEKRKMLFRAFSPEIYGLHSVKMGLLIAAACGVSDLSANRAKRSTCHVLIVGDPGTGKSNLLNEVSKLVSPSIRMNGVGTSDAGLTSCAVRQGKDWNLEAGALVLSDMGICCIDEFNRLKVNEKSGLLESMEQQTLSIAKAGIVTTLNTRCSVLAAASSRYNYNTRKTLSENLGISTPLVSRFDMIFGVFDRKDEFRDRSTAEKVLSRGPFPQKETAGTWSHAALKEYIGCCRQKKNIITDDLSEICLRYYMKKRSIEGNNEFNTVRMLEGLVRIAEAHSVIMNLDSVSKEDVFVAIILHETGINGTDTFQINTEKVFVDEEYFNVIVGKLEAKYELKN